MIATLYNLEVYCIYSLGVDSGETNLRTNWTEETHRLDIATYRILRPDGLPLSVSHCLNGQRASWDCAAALKKVADPVPSFFAFLSSTSILFNSSSHFRPTYKPTRQSPLRLSSSISHTLNRTEEWLQQRQNHHQLLRLFLATEIESPVIKGLHQAPVPHIQSKSVGICRARRRCRRI